MQFNHELNFIAPALALAALMLLFSLARHRKQPLPMAAWQQFGVHFALGVLVLVLGLWYFGRDGMIATYGLLVVAVATGQWVMEKGWRE